MWVSNMVAVVRCSGDPAVALPGLLAEIGIGNPTARWSRKAR